MSRLFGHLALRFGSSPENLATEALQFILAESAVGRRSFVRLLNSLGGQVPESIQFRTQAGDENRTIPDVVGQDSQGIDRVIIEAKFWAGLTENQPVMYLNRLPIDSGLVIFIAPARRGDMLWHELLQRCQRSGLELAGDVETFGESRFVRFRDGRNLAVTSWRAVIEIIHLGLVQAGETLAIADLLQLQGLTDRMDCGLFLPFTGEELTSNLGTRVVQLCQIVDRTVERMATISLADTTGCRASGGRHGIYSQYFRMGSAGCRLFFHPIAWSEHGHPLELEILDAQWRPSLTINARLSPLAIRYPRRVFQNASGTWFSLEILIGVELDAVIAHLIAQIREASTLIETGVP